jgi:hypothetical protein
VYYSIKATVLYPGSPARVRKEEKGADLPLSAVPVQLQGCLRQLPDHPDE